MTATLPRAGNRFFRPTCKLVQKVELEHWRRRGLLVKAGELLAAWLKRQV